MVRTWTLVAIIVVGLATFACFMTDNQNAGIKNARVLMVDNYDTKPEIKPGKHRFSDPKLAKQILSLLDVHQISQVTYAPGYQPFPPFDGLKIQNNYCEEHRAYLVNNTDGFFESKNLFCDYWPQHPLKSTVVPSFGVDVHPGIHIGLPKSTKEKEIYALKPDIHIFYTNRFMFQHRTLGRHFTCLSQASNHIPGHDALYRKDQVALHLSKYLKENENSSACLDHTKFFPKTWVLASEEQCVDFFKELSSSRYQQLKEERNIVFYKKTVGLHEGKGVFPLSSEEEKLLREEYQEGARCGQEEDKTLIQHSIHNPLLIEGRKFDFRVYMFVASTHPLIAFYHDGYMRLSLQEYDVNSENRGTFVTNTALSKSLFEIAEKNGTYNGQTAEELKANSYWFFDKFNDYMVRKGLTNDARWVENYLRPEMKRVMIHLLRATKKKLLRASTVSELYGIDLMMDEDLNLWFIEANAIPLTMGWTNDTTKFFNKMLRDQLDITMSLVKSRVKRVVTYVNNLTRAKKEWSMKGGEFKIKQLKAKRREFGQVVKNAFDPEFPPSSENGFQKIIDENLEDLERYSNLLNPADCII